MQTTKHQILVLLKRAGSCTVEEAAGVLSVASMTARQHLVGLERDGLVQSEKVKGQTGRPHFLYKLTPKGEDLFPRRYDLLAKLMLEEVSSLDADRMSVCSSEERKALLITGVADRLVAGYLPRAEGRPLPERVAVATELLEVMGGFAEWREGAGGFEIRDYNCIFAKIAAEEASGCPWHVRLLSQLTGAPVEHELVINGHGQCCRYVISGGPS
jgi:predicted ArsR family transcriptional regulator